VNRQLTEKYQIYLLFGIEKPESDRREIQYANIHKLKYIRPLAMYKAFIDLDELIVRCRDRQAKQFIKEAVACYKAGAYRSCIVATWNAVVFDFLHKLRELELLEDKEASKLLEQFGKLSAEKKVKELWQFESDIPEKALKPFELISIVEMSDIKRLFEDRSRCAHPSMASLEEPFEATAELARYHLRSAVTHLLERPPVQGRAARDRIFQDIKSEYFPIDPELAIKYFQRGPLARARLTLIKDIIVGLTIHLLTEDFPEDERARQFSAIQAVSDMYPEKTREILNSKLSDIIINKVNDNNWDKVIIYLGKVNIWDSLDEPCQIKVITFINKLKIFENKWDYESPHSNSLDVLLMATRIGFLQEAVNTKLQLPLNKLLSLKKSYQDKLQYHLINTTIEPLLEKAIPEATFYELISMRSEDSDSLNSKIEPHLINKIKEASLEEILDGLQDIKQKDELLYEALENRFLFLVDSISLKELLEVRQNLRFWSKKKSKTIINKLDDYVINLFEQATFDELIPMKSKYGDDELLSKLFKPLLKDNISKIINELKSSSSFANASSNASLLLEAVDFIEPTQWKDILEDFFKNSQIYCSHGCVSTFESLFNKSIKIDVSVHAYWLSFRDKLNSLGNNDRYINSLKKVIDSSFLSK
jgi:hypothetical protein